MLHCRRVLSWRPPLTASFRPPLVLAAAPPTYPLQTPTFVVLRNGEKLHSHGGINETNLHRVSELREALIAVLP